MAAALFVALVAPGMLLMGAGFLWISTVPADVSYATVVVPQMVMLGLGLGLVSTPATESILRVLPPSRASATTAAMIASGPSRAGVGSAVNDATRELGGTLGVAIVGSVFASQYADRLVELFGNQVDGATTDKAADSVGFAHALAAQVPALRHAVDVAFLDGFQIACITSGLLCLVGVVVALLALPGAGHDPVVDEDVEESAATLA